MHKKSSSEIETAAVDGRSATSVASGSQVGNVTGLAGKANEVTVQGCDVGEVANDLAAYEQDVMEWAKRGRALGKCVIPFTRDELQILLQANWCPFFHATGLDVGEPYDEVFDKQPKSCLMANIEDSPSVASFLGQPRCDAVKPTLLRKLASLSDEEVRRLVRIMDAFYWSCEASHHEDYFTIEDER